ncbi:MAG: hypothetical protein LBT30_04525 [Clostridiales bacterium]|jgi:hypothetical protein|nr:hypothetical protein [Clostridiales bacterium]
MEKIINFSALSDKVKDGIQTIKYDEKKKKLVTTVVAAVFVLAVLITIISVAAQPPTKRVLKKYINAFNKSNIEKLADTIYFTDDDEKELFVYSYKEDYKSNTAEYKSKLKSFKVFNKTSTHVDAYAVITLSAKYAVDYDDDEQLRSIITTEKIKISFIKFGNKWYIDNDTIGLLGVF